MCTQGGRWVTRKNARTIGSQDNCTAQYAELTALEEALTLFILSRNQAESQRLHGVNG